MKTRSLTARLTAIALLAALATPAALLAKPRIEILATGGTIAGAQSNTQSAGYKAGSFSIDDIIKAVPQLKDLADITGQQVANIGSQTMNHEVWLKLARAVNDALAKRDTDGVVITHGTDTLEETAYFLSLVVKSDKPVILVGSMRPATAIGADGPANLYNAVALAANPATRGRGPLVFLNDTLHYAHDAEKMNTTHLDTFHSPNRGPAGVMNTGKIFFYSANTVRHTLRSEFSIDGLTVENLPYVEIVYSYANFDGRLIEAAVANGAKGIIVAGVGDGNTTDAALAAMQAAVKKGVLVVRATRVGSGIVDRNVEVNDDQLGFLTAMELNPQKARILLMLGLTKTKDLATLQQLFREY